MTKQKPLTLSLVIPVYNEEHHLRLCLEAIAEQSVMPDEVIVVDNNSTDNTTNIALSYPFVRLLKEKEQGVTYARNRGFRAAKSDLIGRIDADTVLNTDWVANAKAVLADPKIMAATGPMHWYDMPLSPGNYLLEHFFKLIVYKYDGDYPFLLGANMILRRSAWRKICNDLCNDSAVHEDSDLAIHLFSNDLEISYAKELVAGASARRFDDSPTKFYKYIVRQNTSYRKHGIKTWGGKYAMYIYVLFYFPLWPLRRSYNDLTGRRSFRQLIKGNIPRPDPMFSGDR